MGCFILPLRKVRQIINLRTHWFLNFGMWWFILRMALTYFPGIDGYLQTSNNPDRNTISFFWSLVNFRLFQVCISLSEPQLDIIRKPWNWKITTWPYLKTFRVRHIWQNDSSLLELTDSTGRIWTTALWENLEIISSKEVTVADYQNQGLHIVNWTLHPAEVGLLYFN